MLDVISIRFQLVSARAVIVHRVPRKYELWEYYLLFGPSIFLAAGHDIFVSETSS